MLWPVKKEIKPLGLVIFAKIENYKLSKIWRKIAGILLSSGGMEGDAASFLKKLSDDDVDYIRDVFFENMIVENYGINLKQGYDKLCDAHTVFIEIPLIKEAFIVYLGEHLRLATEEDGVFASMQNPILQENLKKMTEQVFSGHQ